MIALVDALLAVALLPLLAVTGYLCVLALMSGAVRPPQPGPSPLRFDVVVPAHDEEAGIAKTVQSLLSMDHPRTHFRVLVVADNCTDQTAQKAQEEGATGVQDRG